MPLLDKKEFYGEFNSFSPPAVPSILAPGVLRSVGWEAPAQYRKSRDFRRETFLNGGCSAVVAIDLKPVKFSTTGTVA